MLCCVPSSVSCVSVASDVVMNNKRWPRGHTRNRGRGVAVERDVQPNKRRGMVVSMDGSFSLKKQNN